MSSEGRFVTQLFALILALLELGGLVGSYNTAYRDLLTARGKIWISRVYVLFERWR